jgi:hypothetical protein
MAFIDEQLINVQDFPAELVGPERDQQSVTDYGATHLTNYGATAVRFLSEFYKRASDLIGTYRDETRIIDV